MFFQHHASEAYNLHLLIQNSLFHRLCGNYQLNRNLIFGGEYIYDPCLTDKIITFKES